MKITDKINFKTHKNKIENKSFVRYFFFNRNSTTDFSCLFINP